MTATKKTNAKADATQVKAPTRDELVAQAKSAGIPAVSRMTVAQLTEALAAKVDAASTPAAKAKAGDERNAEAAARVANGESKGKAETDVNKRAAKAKDEQKALKAWQKDGEQGDRPVTPNYDAIAAEAAGVAKKKTGAKKGTGVRTVSSTRDGEKHDISARGREARDARVAKGGKRGQGKKLTAEELVAYCAKVQKAEPDAWWYDELWYAHWVAGIAVSPDRFHEAWDAAKKGEAPATPVKAAAAKKAPAVKAVASRKATTTKGAVKKTTAKKGAAK